MCVRMGFARREPRKGGGRGGRRGERGRVEEVCLEEIVGRGAHTPEV